MAKENPLDIQRTELFVINSSLEGCQLFSGVNSDDAQKLLSCLQVREHNYAKNEIIILEGDKPESIGIVISGSIHITKKEA